MMKCRGDVVDNPNPAAGQQEKTSYRILIADDTPTNLALAAKLLRKRGHEVAEAENGLVAVDTFRKSTFDVVLMDVRMPTMDGLEASRLIRAHEAELTKRDGKPHHTLIIALTANDDRSDRDSCRKAGMDGFISKPLDIKTVDGTIREIYQQCIASR
jgi:CheY-like chemotaxis protein